MEGRSAFTGEELEELRRLLWEKKVADRDRQKVLRRRMRAMEFYISDFTDDQAGFTDADLDLLVKRGAITVKTDG